MRRLLTTTAALLALAAPLLAAAPSSAAPPDIAIKPGAIKRGPDIAGAHLEGKTIVDGDVRVTLKAPRVLLYGKSNDVYVVATGDREWGNVKLWQVSATGRQARSWPRSSTRSTPSSTPTAARSPTPTATRRPSRPSRSTTWR